MFKMFSKLLLTFLISILMITSICYATDAITTSETTGDSSEENTATIELEISEHYGDLYLFESDVNLEKIIYGNVYILGNNVQVNNCQIQGNLFIIANNISINKSFINGAAYLCAKDIYYNAAARYFYTTSQNLEMTYESYVISDAHIKSNNANILAAIGRDLKLNSKAIHLGEGEKKSIIYGSLSYTSPSEIVVQEGTLEENDSIKYTPMKTNIVVILLQFLTCMVTTLAIGFFLTKLTTKFIPKLSRKLEINRKLFIELLKCFGIGLLTCMIIIISISLLLLSRIGLTLAVLLFLIFVIILLLSVPAFLISIANALKPILKIEKNIIYYIVLAILSIIFYALTLIPYVGIILNIIIKLTVIGFILFNFLPHKELTDEEKAAILENKQRIKQEKLEAKNAKKIEKENKKNQTNL